MDIEARLNTLISSLKKANAEAMWISSPHNHLYFSGFANPDGRILVTLDGAYVLADFRYAENARRLCGGFAKVIETADIHLSSPPLSVLLGALQKTP